MPIDSRMQLGVNFFAIVLKETDQCLCDVDTGQARVYLTEEEAVVAHYAMRKHVREITVVKPLVLVMEDDRKGI